MALALDKKAFFDYIRKPLFGGSLTQLQVGGLDRIIDYWLYHYPMVTVPQFAYILATVHHETGKAFSPIRERGSEAYLRSKKYYPWVGEGLVQVTWEKNARKFGAKKPGDLLTWPKALYALFRGMFEGMFTGKRLSDYINEKITNFKGARKIVNGVDCASLIESYAHLYLSALKTSVRVIPDVAPPVPVIVINKGDAIVAKKEDTTIMNDPLMKAAGFLSGKKTYIVVIVAMLTAGAQAYGIDIPEWVYTLETAAGLGAVRIALNKTGA